MSNEAIGLSAVIARILNANPALRASAQARYWPEIAAAVVWLLAAATLVNMPVSHDVTWQLWIARQMNAGVGLYTWIMEVNPPLWYWMAQPAEMLAGALSLPSRSILVASVFGLIGLSLALVTRLVADWPAAQRAAVLGGMLLTTIFACLGDFAQREHLCLVGSIPYALLMSRRAEGKTIDLPTALAVGALAAPVIALKHYFILIPVLLELWLAWRLRREWRPVRAETLMLAAGAALYAAAVLTFTPAYLTDIVPKLALAYGDLRMQLLPVFLNRMTLALPVAAFYLWQFRRELPPASIAMLLLTVAFTVSYFLQFKGWNYHIDPVVGALTLAIVLHLTLRPALPRLRRIELTVAILVPVIAIAPALLTGPYSNRYEHATGQFLAGAEPGSSAVMLTTKPSKIWPMVDDMGLVWPSRYFHFWMLQTLANSQISGEPLDPQLAAYLDQVRIETVEDFLCNPPDLLIDDAASLDLVPFNILAFFMAEPRFAALFAAYETYGELGPFTGYRRTGPLPEAGTDCVTIAPKS